MKKQLICLIMACLVLSSCATKAKNILPVPYFASSTLKRVDCDRLNERLVIIKGDLVLLSNIQNRRAKADVGWVAGFVILGLFVPFTWIAAIFPKGNDGTASKISSLKGEMLAIELWLPNCNPKSDSST